MEGHQMRVMRVIAGNFSTNVNKVSKEEIQVNVYGWKRPRYHPHHPHELKSNCTQQQTCAASRVLLATSNQGLFAPRCFPSGCVFPGVAIVVTNSFIWLPLPLIIERGFPA